MHSFERATEEQRAVIEHLDGPAFVSSGPGGGKTACVTYRIAYLIDQGADPRSIVGITFTNKAANEMKERVKSLVDPQLATRVALSTFHSFCVRLMRANPALYGILPNFGIADESDAKQILTFAMAAVTGKSEKEVRAASGTGDVMHVRRWISGQKDILLTPDDLEQQIKKDEHSVKFREFLPFYTEYQRSLRRNNLLDFDDLIMRTVLKLRQNPAEQQLFAEHLRYLMVDEYQDTNLAQFELVRLLSHIRMNVLVVGDNDQCLPGGEKIRTPAGPKRIDSLVIGDEVICGAGHGATATQAIEKVLRRNYIGKVIVIRTKRGHTVRATPEHCFFGKFPPYVSTRTMETLGAKQTCFTTEGIYNDMPVGNLFPGMLVPVIDGNEVVDDEIVEVSRKDYSGYVYDLSIPNYRNYCAEGVLIHNSIYAFRGSDPKNANKFYQAFPDTATYLLQTNFRSVPGIAAVANKVIKQNERKHEKEIITHKQDGPSPQLIETKGPDQEARFIIGTIRDLVRAGKYSWKDFAVIYRIRSLSRVLEDEAVARNIPYRVVGTLNFYSRACIKDILSYCRLLQYPHDDAAFTRIHNKPARGIGPANFSRFVAQAGQNEASLMKTLRLGLYSDTASGPALSGFRKLKRLFKDLRAIGTDLAGPPIRHVVEYSGYMYFAQNIKDQERSDRMQEDLHELIVAAEAFDRTHTGKKQHGIGGFLEHATLMQRDDQEEDKNVVLLMTAHAAKGLEFPVVFVCGAVEGVMPLNPRSDDKSALDQEFRKAHYEEERRVFFVAVTRAEERLLVTYPLTRRFGPDVRECVVSRFCREAGTTLEFSSLVKQQNTQMQTNNTRKIR